MEQLTVECYSDASFGNLAGGGSQGGYIIFLSDPDGSRCPLSWQSRKVCRVVKSTLAAETLALLDAAEAGVYLANLITEVVCLGSLLWLSAMLITSLWWKIFTPPNWLKISSCELTLLSSEICSNAGT